MCGAHTRISGEVDRLFEDFWRHVHLPPPRSIFDREPAWQGETAWAASPAVDIIDSGKAYEIIAELPGLDEKNIEVAVIDGNLTIKGEKQSEAEEKQKGYYVRERQFGSFERSFRVPEGVNASKIEAAFKNGVLTVTLPKTVESQKPEQKITVKAA